MGSFILGLIDDKLKLSYKNKFAILIPLLFICIFFSESFIISKYKFEVFKNIYTIENNILSVLITCFFLLLLMNAINLIDGINALANSIITIIFFFIFLEFDPNNLSLLILLFFLFINCFFIYKGRYFLGDSGSLSISTFVGLLIIYEYNSKYSELDYSLFNAEDIFILMAFPGLDMIRVFFERIINGKSPFSPSREHLHHYLLKKHSLITTLTIYIIFAFIPVASNFLYQDLFYTTYNLFACIILYIVLLKYSRISK